MIPKNLLFSPSFYFVLFPQDKHLDMDFKTFEEFLGHFLISL